MFDLTIEYECAFEKNVPGIGNQITRMELNALLEYMKELFKNCGVKFKV